MTSMLRKIIKKYQDNNFCFLASAFTVAHFTLKHHSLSGSKVKANSDSENAAITPSNNGSLAKISSFTGI